MRWRLIAVVSVGINLAMGVAWLMTRDRLPSAPANPGGTALASTNSEAKPNVVVRRQLFTWRDLESPDYRTYIANLRDIGCPEQTIRDIIIADVNALFSRRLATELLTTDQQWWRSEPDPDVQAIAQQRAQALEEERRALLSSLLGGSWETGDLANLPRPSRPGVVLDGPVLGTLPAETKQAVQETNLRSRERLDAYLERVRAEGGEADPAELAKIRQQTREELAGILGPPQLEEYLLRYSQTANDLRSRFAELRFFEPTPDEFRMAFRSIDGIEQQLGLLGDAMDPNTQQARRSLEAQRDNMLRLALGNERFQQYQLLQDPLYRDAFATAQQAGTPEAVQALYQFNRAAVAERERIAADNTLTAQQKNIELKQLELEQMKATAIATGEDLPPEPPPPPTPAPRRIYTMRSGENLAVIAMIHGVTQSEIRAANPDVDFNRLKPGVPLNIPRSTLPPPYPPLFLPSYPAPIPP
jgi:LysM repeat protein